NPLQPMVLLSERERTTLSRLQRNVLRFHRLGTRARVCSYCKSELKCPECSIFAYYQKCDKCPYDYSLPEELPQYTSVCPKCVSHGALIPWPGIPSFHRFNHFLEWEVVKKYRPVVFLELKESKSDSDELESEDEEDSRDEGDEEMPKLRWRCHFHTPQEQALTKIYRELENKDR
ncbi:hypothetical protein M1146_06510, partial [Patescibacteria group bacterium]|nr:hypothetical protein [Patescibacteria group bacterium]